MNILPKKRWHVRTKENIARVRRDEAKAKEEEEEKLRKIELAEKEARRDFLRNKARSKYDGSDGVKSEETADTGEHVNFFKDLEAGDDAVKGTNKDYEKEKKEETEKYEKQIGYLTYLGQDTVESTGKISWFNKLPERHSSKDKEEVQVKKKLMYDPLMKMNFYLDKKSESTPSKGAKIESKETKSDSTTKKKKHKKKRKHRSSSSEEERKPNLEELRAKRLKREAEEKTKREIALAKLLGKPLPKEKTPPMAIKQKYNSQFNPQLAKQNKVD